MIRHIQLPIQQNFPGENIREQNGHFWENLHGCMLVYLTILPINKAIDPWENICSRVNTTSNVFPLESFSIFGIARVQGIN